MAEPSLPNDAQARPEDILGVRWPNLIGGSVTSLVGGHGADSAATSTQLFRIELDTPMSSEEYRDLEELVSARKFMQAAELLIHIRHVQGIRTHHRFIREAFRSSEMAGCLAMLPQLMTRLLEANDPADHAHDGADSAAAKGVATREKLPRIRIESTTDYAPEIEPEEKQRIHFVYDFKHSIFPPPIIIKPPFEQFIAAVRASTEITEQEKKILCAFLSPGDCFFDDPDDGEDPPPDA